MKYLLIIPLVLFLLSTNLLFGQPICDTLSSDLIKQFDSYTPRQFKKLKKQRKLEPIKAFEIATYFRQKGDTTCKQWYILYLNLMKKHPHRSWGDKVPNKSLGGWYIIFYIAQAYYFTDNLEQAYNWYVRAYKANISDSCMDYYYEEVKRKLGKTE